MFRQFRQWLADKIAPAPLPDSRTVEDRLWDAVEEFNDAWAAHDEVRTGYSRLKPWLDWQERQMILTSSSSVQIHRRVERSEEAA